jgi:hypothetical protein
MLIEAEHLLDFDLHLFLKTKMEEVLLQALPLLACHCYYRQELLACDNANVLVTERK